MRIMQLRTDARGIALPVALFALVVIGVLVAGVFFTARLEMRGGQSTMSAMRASEAAQGGLQLGVPNALDLAGNVANGVTITGTRTQIGTSGSYYQYSVTKLNRYMFLVKSVGEYEGRSGVITARRTMAQLVKRYMPELNVNSGATIVGEPSVGSAAVTISGDDHTPTGWTNCDAPGTSQPAIRTNSTTTDLHKKAVISPAAETSDTTVTNMSAILDTLFFQLAGQANIVINATGNLTDAAPNPTTAGTCVRTGSYNWGDLGRYSPAHACEGYFPIVYINAVTGGVLQDVRIGGTGQGVLLINGNMEMNAGTEYTGLILVRGQAGKANGTAKITGGIVSQNADLDADGADFSGTLTINYSRCAVKTALNNLAVTAPTQYRGFLQF